MVETQSSYTLTGLFVVGLASAGVVLSLWLVGDVGRGETSTYAVDITEESVSGLEPNSRVLMQGVPVGRIESIALDPRDPRRVRVLLSLATDTPVRVDTEAILRNQGLTGLMRLELQAGSPDAELLKAPAGEPYPVITHHPSAWANLEGSMENAMDAIEILSQQMERTLTDENMDALSDSLHAVRGFTASLEHNSGYLDRIMQSAAIMGESGEDFVQRLPATLDQMDRTLVGFEDLAKDLRITSTEVKRAMNAGREGVETITRHTIPEIDVLVRDIRFLSASLQRLIEDLGDQPTMLLFDRSQPRPGPGE